MNLIDYNCKIEKCYKDIKEIQKEYIESIKDTLDFKVGDKVRIKNIIFESDKNRNFYNKEFEIIEIVLTFDIKDNISYKLNTGTKINLFKEKYLIKS